MVLGAPAGMPALPGSFRSVAAIFRDDFSNAFVTKRQTDRLRREAKAPEYGALQTLRAIWLRLGRAEDPARRDALPAVSDRLPSLSLGVWSFSKIDYVSGC